MEPHEVFDDKLTQLIGNAANLDLTSEEATTAMKNLKTFSECRPPAPDPELDLDPVPTTVWGKFRLGAARALDNETTRTIIKAGGALAGVVVVAYSTIHRDHVIERQALAQANQRNS